MYIFLYLQVAEKQLSYTHWRVRPWLTQSHAPAQKGPLSRAHATIVTMAGGRRYPKARTTVRYNGSGVDVRITSATGWSLVESSWIRANGAEHWGKKWIYTITKLVEWWVLKISLLELISRLNFNSTVQPLQCSVHKFIYSTLININIETNCGMCRYLERFKLNFNMEFPQYSVTLTNTFESVSCHLYHFSYSNCQCVYFAQVY